MSGARNPASQAAMHRTIHDNYEALSQAAAAWLIDALRAQPRLLLCAATGASPQRAFDLFAARHAAEPALFTQLRLLKLDEWGGLAMTDAGTCEAYLQRHLVRPLQLPPDRCFGFESNPADPAAECERVRAWLAVHGPIDVCVLGLGTNGHLALNEPADYLHPGPHVAELAPTSLEHGMLRDAAHPPRFGLTLGLGDILQARRILLLVSGRAKRAPFDRLRAPEITPRFPASFLWLHPAVTCFCDRDAHG